MSIYRSLDALVKHRLRQWPQRPPGLPAATQAWLRGRPSEKSTHTHPFLKFPGSEHLRTLPDGLWLNFGGTPVEPFVDIFAVEACGTLQNLLDKRSRFAPSTHSMLAVCPVPWLLGPAVAGDPTPRWRATGVMRHEPVTPLVLPVRDIRVMYALKRHHYEGFAGNQLPHPHEYFLPMEALTAEDAHNDPHLQAFVARASATANFLTQPAGNPASRPGRRCRSPQLPTDADAAPSEDRSPSRPAPTGPGAGRG